MTEDMMSSKKPRRSWWCMPLKHIVPFIQSLTLDGWSAFLILWYEGEKIFIKDWFRASTSNPDTSEFWLTTIWLTKIDLFDLFYVRSMVFSKYYNNSPTHRRYYDTNCLPTPSNLRQFQSFSSTMVLHLKLPDSSECDLDLPYILLMSVFPQLSWYLQCHIPD